MTRPIGILSYGCGNIRSVSNALEHCGYDSIEIIEPNDLHRFDKLVLPGVGAFDTAMSLLEKNNLHKHLLDWTQNNDNKLLGICVGMQLLCSGSEESTEGKCGLNLISAKVKKLTSNTEVRLPNIGWSAVQFTKDGFEQHDGDYYFVHSYGAFCDDEANCLAYSYYGDTPFHCAISNGANVFGYQFHLEKSHKRGLSLLQDFCAL